MDPSPLCSQVIGKHYMDRLRSLSLLSPRYKPMPRNAVQAFMKLSDRLGTEYAASPSEKTLFRILAAPKVCLSSQHDSLLAPLLRSYPEVPWPLCESRAHIPNDLTPAESIQRLVEQERYSTAARRIRNDTQPVAITDDVFHQLQALHPSGPEQPFSLPKGRRPKPNPSQIDEDLFSSTLSSIRKDSTPGPTGWTVELLRIAFRTEGFKAFITSLANGIIAGHGPSGQLLTMASLIALPKEGSTTVRPIAISEIIYRFVTKVIVRHLQLGPSMLPNQFGVGTKGGVEPIVSAIHLAARHELPRHFTHLTILDASNAFNSIDRATVAQACNTHAPDLFKAARWSYGHPALLITKKDNGELASIKSVQGVRQGDPLSSALFSLGIRPFLERLIEHMDEHCLVLAYLDDIFILSADEHTLNKTLAFFESDNAPVSLNAAKCSTIPLSSISEAGTELLGTAIGSREYREAFLTRKVASVESYLPRLADLPHQHSLLLLRLCLQHDLRHLLRSPSSADLKASWARLDAALWSQIERMRGGQHAEPERRQIFDAISQLPVKLGGLGITSHQALAPLAAAAANASSRLALKTLLPALALPTDTTTQRERSLKHHTLSRNISLTAMSMAERIEVLESASRIGYAWLSVTPTRASDLISDSEVSAGLRSRYGRQPDPSLVCHLCASAYTRQHPDVCDRNPRGRTVRHNLLVQALARFLRSVPGTSIALEPPIEGSPSLRNDLRITSLSTSRIASTDIDLSVVAMATSLGEVDYVTPVVSRTAMAAATKTAAFQDLPLASALDVQRALLPRYRLKLHKVNQFPDYASHHNFRPLVLSAGGILEDSALSLLRSWFPAAGVWAKTRLWKELSLVILRCRASASTN